MKGEKLLMTTGGDDGHVEDYIDVLMEERRLMEERVARSDGMLFNLITVAISPLLLLTGYAILNFEKPFGILLLLLPFLTTFGILILALLYVQQMIAGSYQRYLANLLNESFGHKIIRLEDIDRKLFASGFNVQIALLTLSGSILLLLNILAAFSYPSLLVRLCSHLNIPESFYMEAMILYWSFIVLFVVIAGVALWLQFTRKVHELRNLLGL